MTKVLVVSSAVCTALWIFYPEWMLAAVVSCSGVLALLAAIDSLLRVRGR